MKKIVMLACAIVLTGCATNARIEMPVVAQTNASVFENKTFSTEVFYSQPEPGVFSAGQQLPLMPLEQAQLSVGSARVLRSLPDYVRRQLPPSARQVAPGAGDYVLRIEITAYDKKGPAYSDYRGGYSFVTNMLTLGFAPSEYYLNTDFKIKLILSKAGVEVFRKTYMCQEQLTHQVSDFDFQTTLNELPAQLLEKHIILTFNSYFTEAAQHIRS